MNLFLKLLIAVSRSTPYFNLDGYMERWWVLRPRWWLPVSIRLHHILRSDNERHLHDHPWPFLSLILRGGYWEVLPEDQGRHPRYDAVGKKRRWCAPGHLVFHRARDRHRLELRPGETCWTLFIIGRKSQHWGFYTSSGKIHWREYEKSFEFAGGKEAT